MLWLGWELYMISARNSSISGALGTTHIWTWRSRFEIKTPICRIFLAFRWSRVHCFRRKSSRLQRFYTIFSSFFSISATLPSWFIIQVSSINLAEDPKMYEKPLHSGTLLLESIYRKSLKYFSIRFWVPWFTKELATPLQFCRIARSIGMNLGGQENWMI